MLKSTTKRRILILLIAGVLLGYSIFVPFEQTINAYCELEPSARWTVRNFGNGTVGFEWDICPNQVDFVNQYIQMERPDIAEISLGNKVQLGQKVEQGNLIAEFRSNHSAALISVTEAELRREAKRLIALKSGEREEILDVEKKRLRRAEVERDYYLAEYDRIKQLHEADLVSDSHFEAIERQINVLNAEVELAEATIRSFEVGVHPADEEVQKAEIERLIAVQRGAREVIGNGKKIKSPLTGLLVQSEKPGEIITVEGIDSLRCKIVIPESFTSALSVRSKVQVSFPILERTLTVEIVETGFYGGDTSAVYGVGFLNNKEGILKPGMHGSATVSIGKQTLYDRISSRIGEK